MSVWDAAFFSAQERLVYVFAPGVFTVAVARPAELICGTAELNRQLSFVPPYWGIDNPLYRAGLAVILLWIVLSVVFTIATRQRIRRDNQVRPKKR